MSRAWTAACCLLLSLLWSAAGCNKVYRGEPSLYRDLATNGIPSAKLPSVESIRQNGHEWVFERPLDEVWDACLKIATQYTAFLAVDADGAVPRMLFLHGRIEPLKVPGGIYGIYVNYGLYLPKFVETWVAVAVNPVNPTRTAVTATWVSPATGEAASLTKGQRRSKRQPPERVAEEVITQFFQDVSAQLLGPARWHHMLDAG